MKTATEAIKEIRKIAEEKNFQDKRILKKHIIGTSIRQGDLYIHAVAHDHPAGTQLKRNQLANGTSLGARHIIKGAYKIYEGIKLPDYVSNEYPLGYVFDVEEVGTVITHPEHAHIEFQCIGRFQVTHQMDMRTLQRVSD